MGSVRDALSSFNFTQKYARYLPSERRRETWEEACARVLNMHRTFYEGKDEAIKRIEWASELEKDKKILSSQRARQFGGTPILRKNWRIYNCTTSYCDRPRFFQEAFWMLLCGCGVGFSVQRVHTDSLPPLIRNPENRKDETFVIPDTIEGWADAIGALIYFYLDMRESRPVFDYSEIRPKGAALSGGGKAPGPEPLKVCLDKVEALLKKRVAKTLRPIDCFDIVMFASDAVLSGGVRRAASIALFDAEDADMRDAKTSADWYIENPQRARANISAVILPTTPRETFDSVINSTKSFGEPGFVFSSSRWFVYNPCVEIGMAPILIEDGNGDIVEEYTLDMLERSYHYKTKHGYRYRSGWQACNLTEVNCAKFTDTDSSLEAVKAASYLGTAQAGYTHSDYLTEASQLILRRESLVGVSLTGMANCPRFAFDPSWQKEAASVAVTANKKMARLLGIPQASRVTCVKPSGNAAVLLGCASGVHPEYAVRYLRRVQVSGDNPVGLHFKKHMPNAVQKSAWSAPGTEDMSIIFPIYSGSTSVTRENMSALDFLQSVLLTQTNWVRSGTAIPRVESLLHNVSNTCLVSHDEWEAVGDFLWENRARLSGISLLSSIGDYDYAQPPFQTIYLPREIDPADPKRAEKIEAYNLWSDLRDTWADVDYLTLVEDEDDTNMQGEESCANGACEFKPLA